MYFSITSRGCTAQNDAKYTMSGLTFYTWIKDFLKHRYQCPILNNHASYVDLNVLNSRYPFCMHYSSLATMIINPHACVGGLLQSVCSVSDCLCACKQVCWCFEYQTWIYERAA